MSHLHTPLGAPSHRWVERWRVVANGWPAALGGWRVRCLRDAIHGETISQGISINRYEQSYSLEPYCWWLKSCTTKDDDYPITYRVLTIPGGAGFQPSTVANRIWWKALINQCYRNTTVCHEMFVGILHDYSIRHLLTIQVVRHVQRLAYS